ncbi:MAG: NnrU family protein [Amylibacter sp.]
MTLLSIGLAVWIVVHYLKRVLPSARAGLDTALGKGCAKGVIALILVLSIVMMVVGYRGAESLHVYTPIAGIWHLNNLLMFVAIMLFGMGSSKGKMRSWFRHPMLMGVIVWAGAHLLVNGDLASVVLFGGMAVWAVIQMALINRAVPDWTPLKAGPIKRDIRLVIIVVVLFIIIASIHIWLGRNPFLGTYP